MKNYKETSLVEIINDAKLRGAEATEKTLGQRKYGYTLFVSKCLNLSVIGGNGIGMADRPVFIATKDELNVIEETVNFEYFNGFALVQKQKSINSLHEAFLKQHPGKRILEISSKSDNSLGVSLSAFNLKIRNKENEWIPLESVFQGGKIFERGGPYTPKKYAHPSIQLIAFSYPTT